MVCSGHRSGAVRLWRLVPTALAARPAVAALICHDPPAGAAAFQQLPPCSGHQAHRLEAGASEGQEARLALVLVFECTQSHASPVTAVSMGPPQSEACQMLTGDASGAVVVWGARTKRGGLPKWAQRLGESVVPSRQLQQNHVVHVRTDRAEAVDPLASATAFSFVCSVPGVELPWQFTRTFHNFIELAQLLDRRGGVSPPPCAAPSCGGR